MGMSIRNMQGTPSYLQYVGPKGRKRKKNCVFNYYGSCYCKSSQYYLLTCGGRMSCSNYDDSKEAREKYEQEKNKEKRYEAKTFKVKKYEVQELSTKKIYNFEVVKCINRKSSRNEFLITSVNAKILMKSKMNEVVELYIDNRKHEFRIIRIKTIY